MHSHIQLTSSSEALSHSYIHVPTLWTQNNPSHSPNPQLTCKKSKAIYLYAKQMKRMGLSR